MEINEKGKSEKREKLAEKRGTKKKQKENTNSSNIALFIMHLFQKKRDNFGC